MTKVANVKSQFLKIVTINTQSSTLLVIFYIYINSSYHYALSCEMTQVA